VIGVALTTQRLFPIFFETSWPQRRVASSCLDADRDASGHRWIDRKAKHEDVIGVAAFQDGPRRLFLQKPSNSENASRIKGVFRSGQPSQPTPHTIPVAVFLVPATASHYSYDSGGNPAGCLGLPGNQWLARRAGTADRSPATPGRCR
jgi:hypothetical protein